MFPVEVAIIVNVRAMPPWSVHPRVIDGIVDVAAPVVAATVVATVTVTRNVVATVGVKIVAAVPAL